MPFVQYIKASVSKYFFHTVFTPFFFTTFVAHLLANFIANSMSSDFVYSATNAAKNVSPAPERSLTSVLSIDLIS